MNFLFHKTENPPVAPAAEGGEEPPQMEAPASEEGETPPNQEGESPPQQGETPPQDQVETPPQAVIPPPDLPDAERWFLLKV